VHPIVIRFGRLGDMVLLAPMLHCIHRRFGAACHLIGPGGWSAPIYAGHPDVAAVWQIEHRHRQPLLSPEHWRIIRKLRAETGPIYVAETEPRALAKIRQLLALAKIPRNRCVFITDMTQIADEHWVDRLLRLAHETPDAFAAQTLPLHESADRAAAPRLSVQAADRTDRDAWLSLRGLHNRRLVLVQSANKRTMRRFGRRAAADDDKSWPLQAWSDLLRAVRASLPDAAIILCGSPAENGVLEAMRRDIGLDDIHIGARDLPIRRLMALQELAHSMISVDTGPAHLAAALGCPLVVLFGACSAQVWAPRSATGSRVLAVGGAPRYARADQIGADEMINAWRSLLPG
jgi:heptosyltransferase-2/heptosyltransferase-3